MIAVKKVPTEEASMTASQQMIIIENDEKTQMTVAYVDIDTDGLPELGKEKEL